VKVLIEIDCNNAAFDEDPQGELGYILDQCNEKVDAPELFQAIKAGDARPFSNPLRDSNGNTVGKIEVKDG